MEPEKLRAMLNFYINTKQITISKLATVTELSRSTINIVLGRSGKYSKLPSRKRVAHILYKLTDYPFQVYGAEQESFLTSCHAPEDTLVEQHNRMLRAKLREMTEKRDFYAGEMLALQELISLNEKFLRRTKPCMD